MNNQSKFVDEDLIMLSTDNFIQWDYQVKECMRSFREPGRAIRTGIAMKNEVFPTPQDFLKDADGLPSTIKKYHFATQDQDVMTLESHTRFARDCEAYSRRKEDLAELHEKIIKLLCKTLTVIILEGLDLDKEYCRSRDESSSYEVYQAICTNVNGIANIEDVMIKNISWFNLRQEDESHELFAKKVFDGEKRFIKDMECQLHPGYCKIEHLTLMVYYCGQDKEFFRYKRQQLMAVNKSPQIDNVKGIVAEFQSFKQAVGVSSSSRLDPGSAQGLAALTVRREINDKTPTKDIEVNMKCSECSNKFKSFKARNGDWHTICKPCFLAKRSMQAN